MTDDQMTFDDLGPASEVEGSANALRAYTAGEPIDLSKPYAAVAEGMWRAGWHAVLPLPRGRKEAPPEGWTGNGAPYPSYADMYAWLETARDKGNNVAIRMPENVIGIDVDDYPGKPGLQTLTKLCAEHGDLPPTWRSTARGTDNESGIRFYRVPPGLHFRGGFPGIEIIQRVHRYAVVWPSTNPDADGARYHWYDPAGRLAQHFPKVDELPELPPEWITALISSAPFTEAATLSIGEVGGWLRECRPGPPCGKVLNSVKTFTAQIQARGARSRHDIAMDATRALVGFGGEGHSGSREALRDLMAVFIAEVTRPGRGGIVRDEGEARKEFVNLVYGAVRLAAAKVAVPFTVDYECLQWDEAPPWVGPTNPRGNGLSRDVATPPEARDPASPVPARETTTALTEPPPGGVDTEDTPQDAVPPGPTHPEPQVEVGMRTETDKPERTFESAFTEAHLAEKVAEEVMQDRFCWTKPLGWLRWNGKHWQECETEIVTEAVRAYFLDWFTAEVKAQATAERRKAISAQLSAAKIGNITGLCRGIVARSATEFDTDPDVLNCKNGVVDLRTGELHRHDPKRSIMKCTEVSYQPNLAHKDWTAALAALPADVGEWYRVRVGQALTGYMTSDDALIVMLGGGDNGKSTMNGALGAALGSYYVLVSDRVLLANPSDHPTELMDLMGARFALVEETPEARHLNVARLKKVVGTPRITARRVRMDDVTFEATHSLFLSSNYRPIVAETDHGTWRRLVLCTFPYKFVPPGTPLQPGEKEGDPNLRERLLASVRRDGPAARAALAWAVAGARQWYEAGMVMPKPPARVEADTLKWRTESDLVLGFIGDRLDFDPEYSIMSTDLLADFNAWLAPSGGKPWGERVLASRLATHSEFTLNRVEKSKQRVSSVRLSRPPQASRWVGAGFRPELPTSGAMWHGVRFKPEEVSEDTIGDTGGATEGDPTLFE